MSVARKKSVVCSPESVADRSGHRSALTRDSRLTSGFTLPELLIAITIFLTVAGGIALLFTQSIRTVKVGHQNIEVNEHIRAAMDLIETDLTQAFTSRTYGDYYTFYGTPIGMTFVGLVRPNRAAAQPNLSRVTYVLYTRDPRAFISYEDYAQAIPDNRPITFSLLRYVEPNRDTLDNLPLPYPYNEQPWPDPGRPLGSVEPPAEYARLQYELEDVYNNLAEGGDPNFAGAAGILCESADLACRDELVRAKKREQWIRMLAGDPALPRFWADPNDPTDPRADYRDYVLAEDIVLVDPNQDALYKENIRVSINPNNPFPNWFDNWVTRSHAPRQEGQRYYRPLFEFGSCCIGNRQAVYFDFWNDHRNMVGLYAQRANAVPEGHPIYSFGSPMAPRIPLTVVVNLNFLRASPYAGAPDMFRGVTKQIDVPSAYTRSDMTG